MSNYKKFLTLYEKDTPLLLGNVWDAQSAGIMEAAGYEALGTSSAAVAKTLGYEDGENMSFEELLFVVKRIINRVSIPVSVDMEGGYSRNVDEIIGHIEKIHDLGAVGINLEDSVVHDQREILPIDDFAEMLKTIKTALKEKEMDLFLNIRTDTYLLELPSPLKETLKRVRAYEESGADGIFVPCIVDRNDIREVTQSTRLPVNVLCMPNLPSFEILKEEGVKRISAGSFLYNHLVRATKNAVKRIQSEESFQSLFL